MKLNTLKQSLLISLGVSFVSVSVGSDHRPLEEGTSAPHPSGTLITKGITAPAKSKRALIKDDKEFIDALVKINESSILDIEIISQLQIDLIKIGDFLQFQTSKKAEYFNRGKLAFQSLSVVAGVINGLFSYLLSIKPSECIGEKNTINYYKQTGQEALFIYLQTLTKKMLEKLKSVQVNFFTNTHGLDFFAQDTGVLYIFQDKNGPVPVFVNKELYEKKESSKYLVFYGEFKEGFIKRGIVYVNRKLETFPGIVMNNNELCIYFGNIRKDAPFLSVTMSIPQRNETFFDLFSLKNKPLFDYEGYFIPVTDTEKMPLVQKVLLDEACNVDSNSLELLVSILSALSEIMTYEEDRKLAEEERNAARAKKQEQAQKKLASKKAKESKQKIQKIPATSAQAKVKEGSDSAAIQTVDNDLEMKPEGSNTAPEIISSEATNVPRTEVTSANDVAIPNEMMNTKTSDSAAPTVEGESKEPSSIKEEIKQDLYNQVMATVPKGRIKQRVLDRLIGEWLTMTQIPLKQLRTFVRGSHITFHGANGGATVVRKHDGKDYAPGEARELAERIVGLAGK